MNRKEYQKPMTEAIEADVESQILAASYTTTTGLNAMDDDEILGDGAQSDGNSLWGMGADEDL